MLLALLPLPLLLPTVCDEGDHFAFSVVGLGDVDADGVADFLVSEFNEANGELAKAGWIGLVSGQSRELIWELRGEAAGDQYGGWLQSAGDLDGDGTLDFAHAIRRGRTVEVRSGRTRQLLVSFPGRHVVPAGDVDEDGRGDLLVGVGQPARDASAPFVVGRVRSGADGEVLRELRFDDLLRGASPRPVGDVDGDGRVDWGLHKDRRLVLFRAPDGASLTPPTPWWLAHHSGNTWVATDPDGSITLHTFGKAQELRGPSDRARPTTTLSGLGDVDGDGTDDFLLGFEASFVESATARSGATGKPLWSIEDHPRVLHDLTAAVVGDLNGDGVPDVLGGFHWPTGARPMKGWVQAHSGKDGKKLFELRRADLR